MPEIKHQQGQGLYRPPMSDQQVIDQKFGGFKHFLQLNGIPTPTTAELRILLYSQLYVDFKQAVREHQERERDKILNDPRLPEALRLLEEKEKAEAAEKAKKAEENPTDGQESGSDKGTAGEAGSEAQS